jgi:hypothetical protein
MRRRKRRCCRTRYTVGAIEVVEVVEVVKSVETVRTVNSLRAVEAVRPIGDIRPLGDVVNAREVKECSVLFLPTLEYCDLERTLKVKGGKKPSLALLSVCSIAVEEVIAFYSALCQRELPFLELPGLVSGASVRARAKHAGLMKGQSP